MRLCIRKSTSNFEIEITNDAKTPYDYCLVTDLELPDEPFSYKQISTMDEILTIIQRIMKQTGTIKSDYRIVSNVIDEHHRKLSKFIMNYNDHSLKYRIAWLICSLYIIIYLGAGIALYVKMLYYDPGR